MDFSFKKKKNDTLNWMPAESERGRERESAISPVIRNAKVSLGSLIIQSRKTEGAEKKKKGTLLFHNASPERTFKLGGKIKRNKYASVCFCAV